MGTLVKKNFFLTRADGQMERAGERELAESF